MARFLAALRGKDLSAQVQHSSPLGALAPEGKAIVGAYLSTLVSQAGRRPRRWDVDRAIMEGYERIVWVFKAVDAIAGNCAALPFQLADGDSPVDDHPLLDLLNGPAANPLETGQEFRERLSAQTLLSRRGAFVEMTMTRRNTPTRLDLLPPGRTEIIPGDGDDPIRCYRVTDAQGYKHFIEPERVLWFRKPHPTDPYSGMTPLEAAGLATELDFFADLYNANFMRNDGRPGGILAVRNSASGASMSPKEMDRVEARFGKGPVEAGKMSVISGDMTFIDPAAKPRDTHYADLSDRAKAKILTAFGLDESVVGDTSQRTFANAEQAWENFWLLDPMPAHMRLLANGWGRMPGLDGLRPEFDTTEVEPLRRAKAAKLEEARAEVDAGLRSIKSYADLAGYGDEIEESPQTMALWISQGRTPIPSREQDAQALGAAPADQTAPPGQAPPPVDGQAGPAAIGAGPEMAALPATPSAPVPPQRTAADMVASAQGTRSAADVLASAQGKAHPALETKAAAGTAPRRPRPRLHVTPVRPARSSEADDEVARAAEDALRTALQALGDRYVERTVARLQSPKIRKGTPHFAAEYADDTRVGTKALDTARVADEDTWAADAETVSRPYVEAAATAAATATADDLSEPEAAHPVLDAAVTTAAVTAALDLITESARRQARHLAAALNAADQAGRALGDLVDVARRFRDRLHGWAGGLAVQATRAAVEGSRADVLTYLIEQGAIPRELVRRTWRTRADERVRPSHRRANGQQVPLGRPFVVGSALLRYPGDPLGPPEEVAGCRCGVAISIGSVTVRLVRVPA